MEIDLSPTHGKDDMEEHHECEKCYGHYYSGIRIAKWLEVPSMVECLIQPNEVVIPRPSAIVEFDYPLSDAFEFEVRAKDESAGITINELLDFICRTYDRIYREYDEDDSPYGIWGHGIGDLFIERIVYDPKRGTVDLFIGS
eukprot:GHVU01181408.1.p1 GENE.GHVU01181408.1~~GHVU01181408.1.p1  ORF type:complete len:142 (+),score=15.98 GHVU01181408.1:621-1046(+)